MWWALAEWLNMIPHQPLLNHSRLSGLVPVGEPPSGAYDWSWKPMSPLAAAAGAIPPAATTTNVTRTAGTANRRAGDRIGSPSTLPPWGTPVDMSSA